MQHTPIRSLFLLAVFALGGLAGPWLHETHHAQERAAERAAHTAAGHHHHAAMETHGAEADAPCPEPVGLDLQCVLCQVVNAKLAAVPVAVLPPAPWVQPFTELTSRAALSGVLGYSSRGPPRA
ncbi:MAG: hypothetical protein R3181_09770 [Rubricoccaceae bacterium]|nr:hypothetical protein [Rubricoccaceae bacterium]